MDRSRVERSRRRAARWRRSLACRERALTENWLGEIDGLNLTLTFLRSKRRQAQRGAVLHRDGHADLGMPTPRPKR
jgi:hypothetical protein